jgi:hypothetical protein
MREVRTIETLINKFQNILRKDVHKKQLDDYIEIGYEKQNEFREYWEELFGEYNEKALDELTNLERERKEYYDKVYLYQANEIEQQKRKVPHNIKLLEMQEKLVAINERIEEAANFRNELKQIKKHHEEKAKKSKEEDIFYLKKNLTKKLHSDLLKKNNKIEFERNKLIIDRNKKADVQNKQINLHINDIKRIQNSIGNMYLEIGSKADELKRTKERQRNTNKAISASKVMKFTGVTIGNELKQNLAFALVNLPAKNLSLNISTESMGTTTRTNNPKRNLLALKIIVSSFRYTRFDLNSDFNSRKFCNVSDDTLVKNDNNLKKKIRKILDQRKHKDELIIPPTYYYDDNLNLVTDAKKFREVLPKIAQK